MADVIEIDSMRVAKDHGNIYHNPANQLRRAIGRYEVVYCGGVDGGTVRDLKGKCWDWWPTDERIGGTSFFKIRIVEAK